MNARKLMMSSLLLAAVGCSGLAGDIEDPATFGTLKAELQSTGKSGGMASTYDKVVVTLVKITAHSSTAGWVTLSKEKQTVDLLSFTTDAVKLGDAQLPAGKITQIRLYTAEGGPNYVQLKSGQRIDLKVPSGVQSGIKVKGPFELGQCQQTTATLLMDGNKSIHVHPTGQGDLWILRPVIRTMKGSTKDIKCPGDTNTGNPTGDPNSTPTDPNDPNSTPNDPNATPGSPSGGNVPDDFQDGAGSPCTGGFSCLSGVCSAGSCGLSGPGGACAMGTDCASNACGSDGICAPGANIIPTGGACTASTQCISGSCLNNVCDPGATGTTCAAAEDCASGFSCVSGSCAPQIN